MQTTTDTSGASAAAPSAQGRFVPQRPRAASRARRATTRAWRSRRSPPAGWPTVSGPARSSVATYWQYVGCSAVPPQTRPPSARGTAQASATGGAAAGASRVVARSRHSHESSPSFSAAARSPERTNARKEPDGRVGRFGAGSRTFVDSQPATGAFMARRPSGRGGPSASTAVPFCSTATLALDSDGSRRTTAPLVPATT